MTNSIFRPTNLQPPLHGHFHHKLKNVSQGQKQFASELQSVINQKTELLTISKHAQHRLEQRDIQINEQRWGEIADKVKEAKHMGVKESLVLLDNAALIVSAKNNIVITAMDRDEASQQIFTNINGTIVMN